MRKEISAFRLAFPVEIRQTVKSTIVPSMPTVIDGSMKETFKGYPWVRQTFLLGHCSEQDNVLADQMAFIESCKQKPGESIADFEAHGRRREYSKMMSVEDKLIRDHFVIGVRDDRQ